VITALALLLYEKQREDAEDVFDAANYSRFSPS
jgi:hypothetical protein